MILQTTDHRRASFIGLVRTYRDLCKEAFLQDDLDGGLQLQSLIDKLCAIAMETIPKSYPNPKNPWFSFKCKLAILDLKRYLTCQFTRILY